MRAIHLDLYCDYVHPLNGFCGGRQFEQRSCRVFVEVAFSCSLWCLHYVLFFAEANACRVKCGGVGSLDGRENEGDFCRYRTFTLGVFFRVLSHFVLIVGDGGVRYSLFWEDCEEAFNCFSVDLLPLYVYLVLL